MEEKKKLPARYDEPLKKIISIFEIFRPDNEGSDDERIKDYQKYLEKLQSFLDGIVHNKEDESLSIPA